MINHLFRIGIVGVLIALATYSSAQTRQDSLKELAQKVDALTEELERITLGEAATPEDASKFGVGPSSGKVYGSKKGVTIAGYGDVIYTRFPDSTDDGRATGPDVVDMAHAILYFGYRFNDWLLFNSEIEYEHATTQSSVVGRNPGGYVAVEFAYVDMLFNENFNLRTGLVLNPLGIMSEVHEPPTYLTSVRPRVESVIIPSTWRGIGLGFFGEIVEGLNYRAYVMEGLNAAGFTANNGVRGGRQIGAAAIAEDFGFTGKLEYSGIDGIKIGAGFYTGNSGQGIIDVGDSLNPGTKEPLGVGTTIIEGHAFGNYEGIEFAAMYAMSSIGDTKALNFATGQNVGSKQNGMYVTLGYDIMRLISKGSEHQLSPFIHWEKYNTQAEVATGTANPANDRSTLAFGLAYRPISSLIFKADYRDNSNEVEAGSTATDQINFVIGYMF